MNIYKFGDQSALVWRPISVPSLIQL